MSQRLRVRFRMTDLPNHDGQIHHVPRDQPPGQMLGFVRHDGEGNVYPVEIVPTGDVEWDGDTPIEVWVPEDRLDAWRRLHPQE